MKTVLVVDDEKLIRWTLTQALGPEYVVFTAASVDEALDILGRAPVDAVITDLRMPGLDGFDLVERLRKLRPQVKIFALSAYATDEARRRLREQGVLECLAKPFELAEVLDVLRRHLGPSGHVGARSA
ncbi:MAG: response regulator [Planctomycetota bacterium]